MSAALLNDYFYLQLETRDHEEKFITSGVTWQAYESLLTSLGNSSSYRVAYLLETLEIMSPSRSHELDKKAIARLLEIYLEEQRISFWGLGSTTLKSKNKQAGKEPDECYCIGIDKDIPDLAIELIYTSGSVDTLEIYRRLGVKEVWFWQNKKLIIYCLENDSYQVQTNSQLLPNLDLNLMAQYVTINDPLEAITGWRKQITSNTKR
ncbi:Uma2 family endonuclease [Crocosphaera sp.]|uniref:Uma2 family endonuclease n=1 Tax=Crocosphaera sp. TaxID=2729996 RepID=UPI0026334CB8|nr:Uma2 family endonuclease [Crocosphaera sp.]MDJ0583210.1 Uma2 family endonuclease [Crocosphaera sp.]